MEIDIVPACKRKNNAFIFDPAHGKETKGKRSPDGKHREYLWSRSREIGIIKKVISLDLDVDFYFPYVQLEKEITPRTYRVKQYNKIAEAYDHCLMVPLHNDAAPSSITDKDGWCETAKGGAVWTSKGQDNSDPIASDWFRFMYKKYPDYNFRKQKYSDGDEDYEADFTVIAGYKSVKPKYDSFLIEWLFQTCKSDVELLMDSDENERFEINFAEWLIKRYI
jgi:N-acetylmuramoyl-L-alanine amidase